MKVQEDVLLHIDVPRQEVIAAKKFPSGKKFLPAIKSGALKSKNPDAEEKWNLKILDTLMLPEREGKSHSVCFGTLEVLA